MADLIGLDFWRRILTRVINSCLNKYFEQVETNQVNNVSLLSYWGSGGLEVKVENAKLKRDALVSLTSRTDFPLKINEGRLDSFEVQISDVKNAKAQIILNGLYILLEPVDVRNAANDPDKIKQIQAEAFDRILSLKEHILSELENQITDSLENNKESTSYFASMADTFTVYILKNARVEIKNVHVRWEDLSLKFATGMFFKSIELEKIPDNRCIQKHIIYRQAALKNFAYYWTPDLSTSILQSCNTSEVKFKAMETTIDKLDETFILQPTSVEMPIELNWDYKSQLKKLLEKVCEQTESDYLLNLQKVLPLISANLHLKEITIDMLQSQFQNIMNVLTHLNSTRNYLKWSHLRPYKSKSWKNYWKFAIEAVLESGARDRAQLFSWTAIKSHLKKVRDYEKLYLNFLKSQNSDPNFKKSEEIVALERNLDTHNIAIVRRKVEVLINKQKTTNEKSKTWSSWAGSFFSSSENQESDENSDKLTTEELQKMISSLTPVLNRSDASVSKGSAEPDMYQKFKAKFILENFSVNIRDSSGKRVFRLKIKDTFVEHTKHASPYELIIYQVKAIEINGINNSNLLCNASKLTKNNFIDFRYELFPLKCDYDSTVTFTSKEPLCLIYNAESIKAVTNVFKLPDNSENNQLKEKIGKQTNEVVSNAKQATKLGLKHLANTRVNCKMEIDIQSPIIVLPMDGRAIEISESKSNPVSTVLMNLGRLVVKMEPVPKNDSLSIGNIDINDLEEIAYDTFTINLTDTKVNVAHIQNLQNVLDISETDYSSKISSHIGSLIEPINIEIELKKYINDSSRPADMPKFLVDANLESLEIKAEEERLLVFISILKSIADQLISKEDEMECVEINEITNLSDTKLKEPRKTKYDLPPSLRSDPMEEKRPSRYTIDPCMIQSLNSENFSKLDSKVVSEADDDSFHSANTDISEFWELLKLRFSIGHLKINLYAVNENQDENNDMFSNSTSHLLSLDISDFEISGHVEQQSRNESITKQHFVMDLEGLYLRHPKTDTYVIQTLHLENAQKYAIIDFMAISGPDGKQQISADFASIIINICPYILAKVLNFQSNLMNALDKTLDWSGDDSFDSPRSDISKISDSDSKLSSKSSQAINREIDIKVSEVAIQLSYSEIETDEIMLLSLVSATDFNLKIHQSYDNMFLKAELNGLKIQDHRLQSKGSTICYKMFTKFAFSIITLFYDFYEFKTFSFHSQTDENKSSFFSLQVNLPKIHKPDIYNTEEFSGEVKIEISGLVFIFFYDWLNKILKWNDSLSAALSYTNENKDTILTNKISKMSLAKQKSETPGKYKLNIDMKAPKIVLPRSENSHGLHGLMVDLGCFKITNTLEVDSASGIIPRLLDTTQISGSDVDFCRIEFEDTHSYKISRTYQSLVTKFTLKLEVKRQIYPLDQPHYMEILIDIPDVFIKLSAVDIQEMMLIYKLNFAITEKTENANKVNNIVKVDTIDNDPEHSTSQFVVSVNVNKLGIEFMENENASVACFELENVLYDSRSKQNKVTGMLEEENIKAIISKINLWDRRLGQAQKFIQSKENNQNMIEYFSKTPPSGNKIDDIKVHGFYLLLNVSFLSEIYGVLSQAFQQVEADMEKMVVVEEPLANIRISRSEHQRNTTMVKDQSSSIQVIERKTICKILSWENSELILCDLSEGNKLPSGDYECLRVDFTMSGQYDVNNYSSDADGKFDLKEFGVGTAHFSPRDFKLVKTASVMSSTSFKLKFKQNDIDQFLEGELNCPSVEVTVRPNMR